MNKVGDARIGFVGFPSVGKSTLLTKLTGTFSEVGSAQRPLFQLVIGPIGLNIVSIA